jgi:hypothetical protein
MLQEKYFTIIFKIIQNNLAISVQSPNDSLAGTNPFLCGSNGMNIKVSVG